MKSVLRLFSAIVICSAVSLAQAQSTAPAPAVTPNVIRPADNLVAEGIPAVPGTIAEEAERYTDFRSAGSPAWHPVKRELLMLTRFADTNQVHRVAMPGGARTQLTFFSDRVTGASYHPKAGDYFIFSKDVGGGEWFQYYRFDVSTGAITLLTDGKSRNVGARWSTQGDRIAYGSTRRTRQNLDIWTMNPTDPKTDRMLLQLEGGGWAVEDWSPDDRNLLLQEYVSANESYLWLVDSASGEKRLITPKGGPKVSYSAAEFGKDGKGIWVTTDRDSEYQRLGYLDLASGKIDFVTSDIQWDVENFEISEDGRTIAFVTNEDGVSVLRMLDVGSRKQRPVPKIPVGVIGAIDFHENGREVAFSLSSAQSPSDIYSVEVNTGKAERWTMSETGGLNASSFAVPKLIKWNSFDGKTISGFYYKPAPKFTGKRPVIVNIHGGPEGQARPVFLGRNNYFLNEMGVAILYPNVRGSEGYGKSFLAADNGQNREGTYKDIEALLNWIKQQPDLDGDKIMITGGSYGGHMTLAIATRYNDKIAASLSVVGISNFVSFLQNTEGYRRDLRRAEYGDERDPQMREYFTRTAPLTMAANITKPLFIVQGLNDPRVPASEATQIVETARKNGTPVWYLAAKDEGHGFQKKKNQDFQFYATVMFVREFLLK